MSSALPEPASTQAAVARQLELDLLGELAALLEQEHGPVDETLLAEAEAKWPAAG